MFESIDKKLEKIGLTLIEEGSHFVYYERAETWGIQRIDLFHKDKNKHLIQSYEKKCNLDNLHNMCGITGKEAKLLIKKMRKKGWKLNY